MISGHAPEMILDANIEQRAGAFAMLPGRISRQVYKASYCDGVLASWRRLPISGLLKYLSVSSGIGFQSLLHRKIAGNT